MESDKEILKQENSMDDLPFGLTNEEINEQDEIVGDEDVSD